MIQTQRIRRLNQPRPPEVAPNLEGRPPSLLRIYKKHRKHHPRATNNQSRISPKNQLCGSATLRAPKNQRISSLNLRKNLAQNSKTQCNFNLGYWEYWILDIKSKESANPRASDFKIPNSLFDVHDSNPKNQLCGSATLRAPKNQRISRPAN